MKPMFINISCEQAGIVNSAFWQFFDDIFLI